MKEINMFTFYEKWKKQELDGELIDVRGTDEYAIDGFKGIRNIPFVGAMMNPEGFFSKDKKYYFLCESGCRSHRVTEVLSELGYDATNVEEGMYGYRQIKLAQKDKEK